MPSVSVVTGSNPACEKLVPRTEENLSLNLGEKTFAANILVVVVPLWKDVQTGRTHRFVNAPKMDFLPSNGQAFAASFVNFVVN